MEKKVMKNMEETTNRQYKSSVFKDLFQNDVDGKENFLSLYNALHDTNYTLDEVTIEPEEIKQTLYHTYYNDVSMLVNGKLIVLMEHQSTINENMPLRFLDYVTRLYEKLQLELKVDVYNINKSSDNCNLKNLIITNKCAILNQYSQFVETVGKFYNGKDSSGFTQAIRECIDNGILKEYLKRNATEVSNLLVKEYRYEDDVATQREEAFNMGQQSKSKDVVIAVKEFNVTPETVATKYNVPLDKLLEELKKADEK